MRKRLRKKLMKREVEALVWCCGYLMHPKVVRDLKRYGFDDKNKYSPYLKIMLEPPHTRTVP